MKSKLVRDRYGERIPPEALSVVGGDDLVRELDNKVGEEFDELRRAGYGDVSEYADVLEALMALAGRHGLNWQDVERERLRKLRDRGGFERGLFYRPDLDPTRR